eukprot:GDKI01027567.1.p1 GENE.GDKI01027567.1~~GDKI01027567.1.p1  ORF type:complete len:160 (-),score=50.35 GDKI01027567.1:531-1010(-)
MGRLFKLHLYGECIFSCECCGTHLASQEELISSAFRGRTGPAFLFNRVVNVTESAAEDRVMTTGLHTIVDCYCNDCGNNLGWRYVEAYESSQKYKKGRYILERALITPIDTLAAERAAANAAGVGEVSESGGQEEKETGEHAQHTADTVEAAIGPAGGG